MSHGDMVAHEILLKLCALFGLLDTTAMDICKVILTGISNFEDVMMIETALRSDADCIVTRNIKDYSKVPLPVYTRTRFIELFTRTNEDCKE